MSASTLLQTTEQWVASHPFALAVQRRFALRPPVLILVAAILAWVSVFAVHAHWRHDRFGTFDHDLGIWDQAVWLLANGESFITVRGLDVFAFHASPRCTSTCPSTGWGPAPRSSPCR